MQILLVEDNGFFREAFRQELTRRFPMAIIEEAANVEAMMKIKMSPPQIIFMDLLLPGENGLQLIQPIKSHFPHIHIAMLTSYDFPQYRQAAIRFGADRYFVKDSLSWDEVEGFIKCNSA